VIISQYRDIRYIPTGGRPMVPEEERWPRCCQSDGNLSPIDAPRPGRWICQATSDCHSANAAERRAL
jgi:hypothetical protein